MTINLNNSNKYKGLHFKHSMYCSKGYMFRGMHNAHREFYKNKNANCNQHKILENNMFNHNSVQNKKKETFRRKSLKTENGKFGKEIMKNTAEEKKEKSVLKVLKREMGLENSESNSNSNNNITIVREEVAFINQMKEDTTQKSKKKEMLMLEEIERALTNRTDFFNKQTQKSMMKKEQKEQKENEMEKEQHEKEAHLKIVSTQKILNLLIKKVNGTLCEDVEQNLKEKTNAQTHAGTENILEMNTEVAKGKEENKLYLNKLDWNIIDSNKMDSNKIGNFYMLEQLEQTFYNNLEERKKEKKTQTNMDLEDIGTVVDVDAHMKKKMGEEILNMINRRYTEQNVQTERGLNRQFSAANEFQMIHENKISGKDLMGFTTRINGYNNFPNTYKVSNYVNTGSNNSTIVKYSLEGDMHLLRNNKKVTNDFNNTNVEDINGIRILKNIGNKSSPLKITTRNAENSMENNTSFKKELSKSKNIKNEKVSKKKKGEPSLFVMPLFMRSPEPEQIPIPVYLSDDGKDATNAKKEQCLMLREQMINTEKDFITVENSVLIRNGDIMGNKGLMINNGNNEKELSWDSNNTDVSFLSSKSGEKSIKHILNFHLNKKPLTNTPRKNGFKIAKKNNGTNSNNAFSCFNSNFNKEINKNGKFDILNNSVRSFKKKNKAFNAIKFNEVGSENHCGNGFFNQNQNIKQYKVDKYINIRKFKTKSNFYDGYRSRYMYVPPNDIKIAAY